MKTFLNLPAAERRLAFQQVESQLGLQAASVEKDFWVCWTLRTLFAMPGVGDQAVATPERGPLHRFGRIVGERIGESFGKRWKVGFETNTCSLLFQKGVHPPPQHSRSTDRIDQHLSLAPSCWR